MIVDSSLNQIDIINEVNFNECVFYNNILNYTNVINVGGAILINSLTKVNITSCEFYVIPFFYFKIYVILFCRKI